MRDEVLIFEGSKKKAALLLLIATMFVVLGLFLVSGGIWFGWVVVCFFGLGIPVSLLMLTQWAPYLKLDKTGFEMKTMFKPLALKWSDVDGFYIGKIYGNKMIGIAFSSCYNKEKASRNISSVLSGMEGALPDHFKSSPEEICEKLNLWKQRYGLMPESNYIVKVNDLGISCTYPNGDEQSILWDEINIVNINTNDSGPWGIDVIWGFHGKGGEVRLAIPGGATGEQEMLSSLQRLPGFKNEEVIKAMSCTSNNIFECWRRTDN